MTYAKFHLPPLAPGITANPMCYQARIDFNCNFNQGNICLKNHQGHTQCFKNNAHQKNHCQVLAKQCRYQSSKCVEGARDLKTGVCYVQEKNYDCGHFVNIGTHKNIEKKVICPNTDIKCLNNDCIDVKTETNTDFIKAAAQMRALDTMMMDKSCVKTSVGNETELKCSIFNGTSGHCKKAVGGLVNCCKDLPNVSLSDYMQLAYHTWDLAGKVGLVDKLAKAGLNIPGAWDAIKQGGDKIWSKITDPFVSAWDSLAAQLGQTGAETVLKGASTDGLSRLSVATLKNTLMATTHQWMEKTFDKETANLFLEQTGDTWALATPLSTILWVYTAYKNQSHTRQNDLSL